MEKQPNMQGKKVFFLYPHSVIRDELLDLLIMAGYETYTVLSEKRAKRLLAEFPDSIIFINIDEGLKEKEWETYIKDIQSDPKTENSQIGILSYNLDRQLMQKYLMEMAISCGYIQLKLGIRESTKIILTALEANEARGRRKYIRADCKDDINATINFKYESKIFNGKLLDISSAGVAALFEQMPDLPANSLLKEVQLKLRASLLMTDMILMGQRHDDKRVGIMLFDPNKLDSDNKLVIHHYIKLCLQKYIDGLKI